MRKWLARLSFSFILIAIVLFWEASQDLSKRGLPSSDPRVLAKVVGAVVCFILGLAGLRERHGPQ